MQKLIILSFFILSCLGNNFILSNEKMFFTLKNKTHFLVCYNLNRGDFSKEGLRLIEYFTYNETLLKIISKKEIFSFVEKANKELIDAYGVKILKQRPWKVSIDLKKQKAIYLKGSFYSSYEIENGSSKRGGVAHIWLDLATKKTIKIVHFK